MTKYTDYFGKPIDWDDWLVSLHDFKSGAYKTDKSLVFQIPEVSCMYRKILKFK